MSDPIYVALDPKHRFKIYMFDANFMSMTVERLGRDGEWRSSQDEGTGFEIGAANAVADAIRLMAARAEE